MSGYILSLMWEQGAKREPYDSAPLIAELNEMLRGDTAKAEPGEVPGPTIQ